MTTIRFKQGDIFTTALGKYGLCIFYGSHGMAFGLGYFLAKDRFEIFRKLESPFETHPNEAIEYSENKYLVCVPYQYMTDDALSSNLTHWLNFAQENKIEKIALTGVRDSSKQSIFDVVEARKNDDDRVKFIVESIESWLKVNTSSISEVLLIAMSDNYTRNYTESIVIN